MEIKKYKVIKDGEVVDTILSAEPVELMDDADSVEEVQYIKETKQEQFRYQALDPLFMTSYQDIMNTFTSALDKHNFTNSTDTLTQSVIEDFKAEDKERTYTLSTFEELNAAGNYPDDALANLNEKLDPDVLTRTWFESLGYSYEGHIQDPDDSEQIIVTLGHITEV